MLKAIILAIFLTTTNAYLTHGPTQVIPPNYGHYGNYGSYGHYEHSGVAPVASVAPVTPVIPATHSYNHITEVAPYLHPKTVAAPTAPIVNPYPAASRHAINGNYRAGYIHSGYGHTATSSYVPPPVISPPTVTYNHNVIPPSVHNVNHAPAPIHGYPHHHQAHAINYHARYSLPYSPVYAHGNMYQNHVNQDHAW